MAAVQKGTAVIWSVNGITCGGIVGSGIEQSFSRSLSSASKEIIGDGGDCQTKVFTNAKADLSVEVIPTTRAVMPAVGTTITVGSATDLAGAHSGKYMFTGGSQESTVDGETRYTFEAEQYIATALAT
jgi:hypothetical protein